MRKAINILAFETSCDETAAAVVTDGKKVLANIISSQIDTHSLYGGVVPEIASRHHLEAIVPVAKEALHQAGLGFDNIDAIACCAGPGLIGSLLVGVSYAKALAFALAKPLIAVNHWQGHLDAILIEHDIKPPYIALVVSGSHSGLLLVGEESSRLLGRSLDDAAGEAFDKIARALGLPYPGGPAIAQAAEGGDKEFYAFPRAWLDKHKPYDFSFSGLKSAVLNYLNERRMKGQELTDEDICHLAASAQEAICDVLSAKAVAAAKEFALDTIIVVGGVAANHRLRELLQERAICKRVLWPSSVFCTDNAAMIGVAAYSKYCAGEFADFSLNAIART
jgi:N6-L-threonylcarbamoyladenine synthase